MTSQELIAHVGESITKAWRYQESQLDPSILGLTGFSTLTMRHLINNVCRLPKPDPVYLECGLFAGASFCSAISNNPDLRAYGIEDFSQPFGNDKAYDELMDNLKKYCPQSGTCSFAWQNCFLVNSIFIDRQIDVFIYDAEHDYESQSRALPYFFERMANPFVYWVDDYNWASVWQGTADGFAALKDKVFIDHRWILKGDIPQDDSIWHNGLGIFVCSKL